MQVGLNFYKLNPTSFHYPRAYSNHKRQKELYNERNQCCPSELLLSLYILIRGNTHIEDAKYYSGNQSVGESQREEDES